MRKRKFPLYQVGWILCGLLFCSPTVLSAEEEEVEMESVDVEEEEAPLDCSRESLLSFFPKPIVYKVLKAYGVPKDQWDPIYRELEQKDRNVIRTVEEKASKMDPNPLKDLKHRSQAVKLFRDTLSESFSAVMSKYGVRNQEQIDKMLQDIQIEKAKAFAECMERGT